MSAMGFTDKLEPSRHQSDDTGSQGAQHRDSGRVWGRKMTERASGLGNFFQVSLDTMLGRFNAIAVALGAAVSATNAKDAVWMITATLTIVLLGLQCVLTAQKIRLLRKIKDDDE